MIDVVSRKSIAKPKVETEKKETATSSTGKWNNFFSSMLKNMLNK